MSSLDNTIFTQHVEVDPSIKIRVFKNTVRTAEITWSELPTEYFPDKTSVAYLQISDAPNSEFETVHTITVNHPPYFLDEYSLTTYFRSPIVYYRIYFPDVDMRSPVYSNEATPNYYGAEIARRHAISLKEGHAGNLMYLFIKKRHKDRCPDCWDTLRGMRSKTNCHTCLNTGYLGGYYEPIGIYASLSAENVTVVQPVDGTAITGTLQGWTAGYPRISMGDILVDACTRDIWGINQNVLTTHKRVPTKQEFVLQRHDEDMAITGLLQRIPKDPQGRDIRHGEILF